MAFLAPLVPLITTASAGLSLYSGIKNIVGGDKNNKSSAPPTPPPPPAPPSIADAQAAAEVDAKKRRRISMLSGSGTDLTRGTALLSSSDIEKKTLIGA